MEYRIECSKSPSVHKALLAQLPLQCRPTTGRTATDRGGLSETRSFVVTVTAKAPFTQPAASLALNTVNTGQFEIEFHAAPKTAFWLKASSDLKNWSDCPMPDTLAQTGTNGVCRIRIIPSGENQFFRARQMP